MNHFDRRTFVKMTATALAGQALSGCAVGSLATPELYPKIATSNPLGFTGHLQNGIEGAYEPVVMGKLPVGLSGTFYRNGPGIYSRGAERKGSLADGDGMVRMYRFGNGKVSYKSRFVQTEKFREEQAANKFIYGTWTTPLDRKSVV